MAGKFSALFLVGFVAAVVVAPYMMAEARYLPTRGNDDRLTRLKELLTDLLDSGAQPNLEMERPYVDVNGDFSRLRPREYNIPEKSIMELFNPTVPHHQRPRS
ncbi:uncharacterized protein LOC100163518 [Acyrthosiphon pisum]|uniref:Uncharacterized protein n=1 Tax=Acyrthosiphon pisum TaxID=7029 RepID=A0A8R2NRE2_ACYPI|nr:uncharacterized protein LOC100163518 [Acyrthosiphon pisum]|eukprot:XP_001949738.1 PREDICTED: uncharacterized protein LOC100163518 [Acyrthosiphon pisum]